MKKYSENSNALISVVIPTYNRIQYLGETIQSIVNQTYKNWECIIVDDGSSRESIDQIEYLTNSDTRIVFKQRDNLPKGAATCRNLGWQSAKGDYVIFLDSDDLLAPHCLEKRIEIIAHQPDLDFSVFQMLIFSGEPGGTEESFLWNIEKKEPDLQRFLRLDGVWSITGPIWKKEALKKIGGFNENLACWQDVDLHLKALMYPLKYRKFIDLLPDSYCRRHSEGSISQNRINTPEKLQSRWDVFKSAYRQISKYPSDRQERLLSNLSVMLAGILVSSLRTYNFRFFFLRALHPYSFKVLAFKHLCFLYILSGIYLFRLHKASFIKNLADKIVNKQFSVNRTIGKISKKDWNSKAKVFINQI